MLKWFRRDNNDPQAESAPVPVLPVQPAAAAEVPDAAGVGPHGHQQPVVEPSASVDPVADVPVAVVPASETTVPWWRYEGVWRAPKPPATPAAAPAPAAEAPPGRDQGVAAPAAAPSIEDAAPAPDVEAPSAREQDPTATAAAPAGRDPVPASPAAEPSGRDQSLVPESEDRIPTLFGAEAPAPEPAQPRSLRERLAATARALTASVGSLFKRNPKLDDDLLEELETALIQADVGVTASTELVAKLGVRMRKREFADAQALLAALRSDLRALIVNHARPLHIPAAPRPFVILTVGVNGAGKTTTIGKLAMRYKQAGHSVMLAAGDTFRAAAVEQLKTWGDRNEVAVIAQGSGADSASVIFDALQAAKSRGIDVLIADTAGRLHTQGHLMQELAKVKRVLGKIDPEAPHETLLVIDGGTGQNALVQAKQFHQAVGLTGIVVTKLDGTAKGGMVFALCRELGLPIRFIGVGEKREDLREFVADDFVDALLPRELGG